MYRCYDCGCEFDFPATWEEDRGECWGTRCTETVSGCPNCRGDYEEIKRCPVCKEFHYESDLINGVCEECREKSITYESALEFLKYKGWLADFFLCYYYQITNSREFKRSESLDEEFCKIYEFKCKEDIECGKHNFFDDIKSYILDEIFEWTDFLGREVNANENSKN